MLIHALLAGIIVVLGYQCLPDCSKATCRRPLVWRWRRLDDGKVHFLCGRCAQHIDRLRAQRARGAT